MKRYLWIACLVAALLAVVGYREYTQGIAKQPERESGGGREIPVQVAPIKRGNITNVLKTSGDVLPLRQVDVVSRISGYVERIHFDLGDRVAAGQTLAEMDAREHRHRVEENEAAVRVAEATVREKESQLVEAEKQAERARRLREKEFISSQELDQAETKGQTAKAQTELAKAQLSQREAVLGQARYQLELTRVTAPFSGVVTRRLVDAGAFVSTSNPILTIAVPDPLKVIVNIPESDVSLVQMGTAAKLEVDAYPGREFEGRIVRLNSALELSSRTLTAEIQVPNKEQLIKPGMFARVSLVLAEHKDSLVLPVEAVLEEEGAQFVYTVEEGRAKRTPVKAGWLQDSYREVLEGVEEGKQVVVAGQHRLKNGTRVRVLKEGLGDSGNDGQPGKSETRRKGKRKAEGKEPRA